MAKTNTSTVTHQIVPTSNCPEVASAQKLRIIGNAARSVFIEREDAIDAMEYCFACGEHLIMLGPPGTTKSALARYFANAMQVNFFRVLLNPDLMREDLFGPIKGSKLPLDIWERAWSGFAKAHIALLDEVGKASGQILWLFLDAMEERMARTSDEDHPLPIHTIIGASNETLDEEAAAVWDRFTVRLIVKRIANATNFVKMVVSDPDKPISVPFQPEELVALRTKASQMALNPSQPVLETLHSLWSGYANQSSEKISDRRWKRVLKVAAGKALVNGRDAIRPDDLDVARWIIWEDLKEAEKIGRWVHEMTHRGLTELLNTEALLAELVKQRSTMDLSTAPTNQQADLMFKANKLIRQADELKSKSQDGLLPRWEAIIDTARNLADEMVRA